MEVVEDAAKVTSTEASTETSKKASTSTKSSTEASTKELPCLGFSSLEARGSFHGRSEAQRLLRRLPHKLFVKAFEVASRKRWRLNPWNITFYFHGSFRSFHGSSAASTTAPTDIFVLYTTVPPVELTFFSTTWLTHTVYETKGASPYNGWLLRFIGLGLGLGLRYI